MLKRRIPLLFPFILFIGGLLSVNFLQVNVWILIVCFVLTGLIWILNPSKRSGSLCAMMLFVLTGMIIPNVNDFIETKTHFKNIEGEHLLIRVENSSPTKKGYSYEAAVFKVYTQCQGLQVRGKLMIYGDSSLKLNLKGKYLLPYQFTKIETLDNSGFFDYGNYLSKKGIDHRTFLKQMPAVVQQPTSLHQLLNATSFTISKYFTSNFQNKEAASLLNAILLGHKSQMDKESKQLFTDNGLAHLLAISGMHVGIILLILQWLFSWIKWAWLKITIIILGVWFYIMLTGLQIPAMRAGFMFTVFMIGRIGSRNVKSLNSIVFAAMVLLAVNPSLVGQVSFQMSFAAMFSILIFYKPINDLFHFDKVWMSKLWQLIALNISVQVFVLPISIYYFKQLPGYFLITSIISIPFVIVMMWGALVSLFFSLIGLLGSFCTDLLEHIIVLYISILKSFSTLPYSLFQNIDIHLLQLVGWFIGVFVFFGSYNSKKMKFQMMGIGFIPLLLFSSFLKIQNAERRSLVIYDDPKEVIVDVIDKDRIVRLTSSQDYMPYFLKDHPAGRNTTLVPNEIYTASEISFALFDKNSDWDHSQFIDICITEDAQLDLERVCGRIIIPRRARDQGSVQSLSLNNKYYNITTQGAFQQKI